MFGHRHIGDTHLAQVVIEIAAEGVEKPLPNIPIMPPPSLCGSVLSVEPPQQQHQVQNDEVKSALDGIWHPMMGVEGGGPSLRHDRAIEVADGARLRAAQKPWWNHGDS